MYSCVVRYAEIATKGKNRKDFENQLVRNIRYLLSSKQIENFKITSLRGRIIVTINNKIDLSNIFGISSYSYSIEINWDLKKIREIIDKLIETWDKTTTYRVSTKRMDKTFPMTSVELDKEIGAYVASKKDSKVNLKDFEKEIIIELLDKKAYITIERCQGRGGLPVGTQGNVALIVEDRYSLLAGILTMKRGCSIYPISKKDIDISILNKFFHKKQLKLHRFDSQAEFQQFFKDHGIQGIVVNDTIKTIKQRDEELLVLRPLIGYTKEEIKVLEGEFL